MNYLLFFGYCLACFVVVTSIPVSGEEPSRIPRELSNFQRSKGEWDVESAEDGKMNQEELPATSIDLQTGSNKANQEESHLMNRENEDSPQKEDIVASNLSLTKSSFEDSYLRPRSSHEHVKSLLKAVRRTKRNPILCLSELEGLRRRKRGLSMLWNALNVKYRKQEMINCATDTKHELLDRFLAKMG